MNAATQMFTYGKLWKQSVRAPEAHLRRRTRGRMYGDQFRRGRDCAASGFGDMLAWRETISPGARGLQPVAMTATTRNKTGGVTFFDAGTPAILVGLAQMHGQSCPSLCWIGQSTALCCGTIMTRDSPACAGSPMTTRSASTHKQNGEHCSTSRLTTRMCDSRAIECGNSSDEGAMVNMATRVTPNADTLQVVVKDFDAQRG